jgi:hypothetical protein
VPWGWLSEVRRQRLADGERMMLPEDHHEQSWSLLLEYLVDVK